MLADADDDEGILHCIHTTIGVQRSYCSFLDTDGEGEEEEGGGGGGEVVTYETEFDLNKYIQRYIQVHITSRTSNLIGPKLYNTYMV